MESASLSSLSVQPWECFARYSSKAIPRCKLGEAAASVLGFVCGTLIVVDFIYEIGFNSEIYYGGKHTCVNLSGIGLTRYRYCIATLLIQQHQKESCNGSR